ncbi:MAG: methylated-DNA--[protein]-cysteine S-methyltransferase [Deltaproteobacteria bacterium]|nr:methylated-DNA--[protein]-cysteine S-methyltransferase [Deltaproteobacteria bacterium]
MTLSYKEMISPVGRLKLVASENALLAVLWEREAPDRVKLDVLTAAQHHPILQSAKRQLAEYFAGQRTRFELPLAARGTEFQQKVWRRLREIPFGKTKSYLEIAKAVGAPQASRAVGAACGKNPISIIVPCHRVVASNGNLTGFAGGLDIKARLLALEGVRDSLRVVPTNSQDTSLRAPRQT